MLGFALHSWEQAMLLSLGLAGFFAVAVALTTVAVVIAQRRETAAAEHELEEYKLLVDGKVADAKAEGIEAGRIAGNAMVRAAELEKEAAAIQSIAAAANERAENARLEQERLKQIVRWRTIDPAAINTLIAELAESSGEIDVAYTAGDPESQYFAMKILGDVFVAINNSSGQVKWRIYLRRWFSDAMFFGIAIPGPENEQVRTIRHAFSAAHIEFSTENLPVETSPVTLGNGLGWTPPPAHNALILIGLKGPPF